ncbi:uncharacterized protein LOC113002996 isoform X2 [Solenopsis invicta]|nr:uncharacterized protein LOC113002996 isoform X2 [Solenopsis invicta]
MDNLSKEVHKFKIKRKQQYNKCMSKMKELIVILKEKFPNNEIKNENNDLISLLPDFPLLSIKEFWKFNNRLKNDEAIRKLFNQTIMQIGGDTSQKIISNILTHTMAYELGHKMSWTGAKGSVAIKDTLFIHIINSVVNAKDNGKINSIAEIKKHITRWFQHVSDKMRYYLKKQANNL